MGTFFTLQPETVSAMESVIDDMINTELSKNCKLYYPPKFVPCNNCFVADTIVYSEDGPKAIQDIQLGEKVYNNNGLRNVTGLFKAKYSGDLYNLKCWGISDNTWSTADHKYPIIKDFRKKFKQKEWHDESFVLENYEIVEVPVSEIRLGDAVIIESTKQNKIGLEFFENDYYPELKIDDDLLFFFGWWLAEGCISICKKRPEYTRSLCFCLNSEKEIDIADRIIRIGKEKFDLNGKKEFRKNAKNLLVYFHSRKFVRFIMMFGVGALNKHIPPYLWTGLSNSQLFDIVMYYKQGDGHTNHDESTSTYNQFSVATISQVLAYQVFDILGRNGFQPSIRSQKAHVTKWANHKKSYGVQWSGDRLTQKNNVRKTKHGLASIVRKIEKKYDCCNVYNLEVEGEHEFIANGILTKNCVYDPIGHKSANKYLTGGPIWFPNGSICPLCNSSGGSQAQETFDVVRFLLDFNPKRYGDLKIDNVRLAQGLLKTEGFLTDLPKVLKCSYILADSDIENYQRNRYRLCEQPISPNNIVQGRYFEALWERIK